MKPDGHESLGQDSGNGEDSVRNVADGVSVAKNASEGISSVEPIASTNDDAKRVQEAFVDTTSEQRSEDSTQQPHSSLDVMTVEVVSLFQQGYKQEALDATVAFALKVRNELGAKNPIYINALATAAALIDQMGGQLEADALLLEAEDLQEQMEFEAFEAEHGPQDSAEIAEHLEGFAAVDGADTAGKSEAGHANGKPLNAKPIKGGDSDDVGDNEPDDCDESSSDSFDRYAPSSVSDSGDDGDVEGDIDDGSGRHLGDHADEDDDDAEAEAEAITRLTWEVNSQLRQGRAEEAAQLLAEAESVLVGEDGGARLSGVTRAALHTLWATVLDAVGEAEKAQCLYDEAIECLAEEVGAATSASSSDDEDSVDGDFESDNAESVGEAGGAPPPPSDGGEAEDREPEAADNSKQMVIDAEPAFFITDGLDDDANEGLPRKASAQEEKDKATAPNAERESVSVPDADEDELAAPNTSKNAATKAAGVETSESQILEGSRAEDSPMVGEQSSAPSKEENPSPSRPKGPKGVGRPGARGRAPLAPQESAKRTGGGFSAVAAPRPAVPKSKAKAKAKGKAKPKATENCAVSVDAEEKKEEPAGESVVFPCDMEPEQEKSDDAGDDAGDVPVPPRNPPQDQLAAVSRAMTCADHFMGLMNFEKAADKLEEQLVELGSEDCPHRGGDLHVDVYMKYAGVLWWDCDPESAIDAYTAADELLRERPEGPAVRRRRADIRLHLAQVCRGCGDLEGADSHLSDVVHVLSELSADSSLKADDAKGSGCLDEALREAQASLAQVCVQRKEFRRAEKLYMKAFRENDTEAEADREQKSCDATT